MSNEKVAVKFTKSWRGYSAGEVACFGEVAAGDLVKGKVAELVKGGSAASVTAGKGGGKGSGKGGAVKAGSGEASPTSGAGDDAQPAPGTPPADEEPGADDEPKP